MTNTEDRYDQCVRELRDICARQFANAVEMARFASIVDHHNHALHYEVIAKAMEKKWSAKTMSSILAHLAMVDAESPS